MESYVGIDAHCNTGLELAAIEARNGELLWRDRCRLDAQLLREAVSRAPRPCAVVFEQGELATWLYLTLSGSCDSLVVADPRHNRLISTSPDKDDPFDALALAQLARGRYVREVYQPPVPFLNLRLQVRHHYRLNQHITVLKNQTKALFRQHGIPVSGTAVYSPDNRAAFLKSLPAAARPPGEDLFAMLDVAEERKQAALRLLLQYGRRFPPVRRLVTLPEIGIVTAATFAAFLVTPSRFPSRSHIWSYCGFGLTRRKSGSHTEPVRLRRGFNRHLKRVVKSAVERMVQRQASPFAAAYQLRLERGTLPTRAKLAIARKLIDVLCALWNSKEDYDPERVRVV